MSAYVWVLALQDPQAPRVEGDLHRGPVEIPNQQGQRRNLKGA